MEVAQVLLVRSDGALVLQQRDNRPDITNPGKVSAFGGSVEAGETPLQAAVRELGEETNLRLTDKDLTFFGTYQKTKAVHGEDSTVYYFVARNVDADHLVVHEGSGFTLVRRLSDLNHLPATLLLHTALTDYFGQTASRSK